MRLRKDPCLNIIEMFIGSWVPKPLKELAGNFVRTLYEFFMTQKEYRLLTPVDYDLNCLAMHHVPAEAIAQ